MSGKCHSERKEEMKLIAPMNVIFPPRDGRPRGCQRQEDGGGMDTRGRAQSPKVWGREGQRLDCSPGSANALTRVSRDTLTPPDLWMLGGSQVATQMESDLSLNPPGPELPEDGFPPPASHPSPGLPPGLGGSGGRMEVLQTTQVLSHLSSQARDKILQLPSETSLQPKEGFHPNSSGVTSTAVSPEPSS